MTLEQGSSAAGCEWSQEALDAMLHSFVRDRDFVGIRSALGVMAVHYPRRAGYWRNALTAAVEVAQARHASATATSEPSP